MIPRLAFFSSNRHSPRHWTNRDLDKPLLKKWNVSAKRFANRHAIETIARVWSYRELDHCSTRLAERMIECTPAGAGNIGICTGDYACAVIAILAAIKAGRSFAFLPSEDSTERRRLISGLSEFACVVKDDANSVDTSFLDCPQIHLGPSGSTESSDKDKKGSLPPPCTSTDLGLVFTSGTSGIPSGVRRSQRSQLHLVRHITRRCQITHEDKVAMIIPPSFESSLNDIFLALLTGATLCPFPLRQEGSARLLEWLVEKSITYFHCPPSIFRSIARQGAGATQGLVSLRWFKLGGEPLSQQDVETFSSSFPSKSKILLSYGSTETGGTITDKVITGPLVGGEINLSVGTPIPGKKVTIVSPRGTPLPHGEEGEIVVQSKYLSRGYFGDDPRTREQFQTDNSDSGLVSFRTRDRGCFDTSGQLHHLGRLDGHLKIHGVRINPNDIESLLRELPGITDAVVLTPDNETELTAYLSGTAAAGWRLSELRESLLPRLPGGIFPGRVVWLESLPRLTNGKIDRESLRKRPTEPFRNDAPASRVIPRNELESIIADIWKRVLKVEEFGVFDNFFDLGGDSLLALNFQSDLTRRIGVDIPSAILLGEYPTVAHVAEQIHHATRLGYGDGISELMRSFPPLSRLRTGQGGRPIVFLPGGYGTEVEMMLFARLSGHLNPVHPLCGFLASNLYQLEPPPTSVPEIAERYLDELGRLFPDQTPIIIGNCIAGPVAHEMARQLESRTPVNHRPDLILIDSASRRGWNMGRKSETSPGKPRTLHPEFIQPYLAQLNAFIPGVLDGPLHLLVTATHRSSGDSTLGWKNFARGEIRQTVIPGDHHESLRKYRDELGAILSGIINEL